MPRFAGPIVVVLLLTCSTAVVRAESLCLKMAGVSVVLAQNKDEAEELASKVTKGEVVDWRGKKLDAASIEKVLREAKVHPRGMWIKNAIITGSLNLENEEIKHDLRLDDCRFDGAVNLVHSHFKKGLSLKKAILKGPVNMRGAKIDGEFIGLAVDVIEASVITSRRSAAAP